MTASKNIKMEAAYRAMVDRFLGWKLPQDFGPDAGISFTPPPHLPDLYWPTGTNLFHAGQALEMFKHCVELPSAAAVRLAEKNLFDALAAKVAELDGQEPVGEVTHSDVRPGSDGMYRHEFLSSFRIGVQVELYARPVPAEPVNARLLEALIQCRDRFLFYVEHHLTNGAAVKAAENDRFVTLANHAIAEAEAQQVRVLAHCGLNAEIKADARVLRLEENRRGVEESEMSMSKFVSQADYWKDRAERAEAKLAERAEAKLTTTHPDALRHASHSAPAKFRRGDPVRKVGGAAWQGYVVGEYSTDLTAEGYAVESEAHRGSVQIYPAKALELSQPLPAPPES